MASSSLEMLFEAAMAGDIHMLKEVARNMDNGRGLAATISAARNSEGHGCLHIAVAAGNTNTCKSLLDMGIDADMKSNTGLTPLLLAILERRPSCVKCLLDHGANPEATDNKELTPLHGAAFTGDSEILRLLLAKGIPIEPNSYIRGVPLHYAASLGRSSAVKILLDAGANPNISLQHFCSPLSLSINAGSMECVKILIEAGADVNCNLVDVNLLEIAVIGRQREMLQVLLEAGADPNIPNEAMQMRPTNGIIHSNRSLCWHKMNEGGRALEDANSARMLRPQWPKACYRQGAAMMLLKNYDGAVKAFREGLALDPANEEIAEALREATGERNSQCPNQ